MRRLGKSGPAMAFAVLALLGSGCGGGSGGGTSTVALTVNPSISHAEFRRQANAICAKGKTEMNRIVIRRMEKEDMSSVQEMPSAEQKAILIASLKEQLDDLYSLGAPPKDKDKVEVFLDAFKKAVRTLEEEELNAEQFQPILVKIYKPAEAYGLHGCAYGR